MWKLRVREVELSHSLRVLSLSPLAHGCISSSCHQPCAFELGGSAGKPGELARKKSTIHWPYWPPAAPIEVASSQPPRQKALTVDSRNRSCKSSEENRGQEGKSLRRLTCHLRTQPQAPTSRASHHTGHRWFGLETRTVLSVSHPVFTEPENTHF